MGGSWEYSNHTASGTVRSGPGVLHAINLAAGADAATAIVYDNTAASGTIIAKLSAVATGNAHAVLNVAFSTGCHVALTGTGPNFTAAFRAG